ncbi:hypothetical protein OROMI_020048 [Orobanche minor]
MDFKIGRVEFQRKGLDVLLEKTGLSFPMFTESCILVGCDYLKPVFKKMDLQESLHGECQQRLLSRL